MGTINDNSGSPGTSLAEYSYLGGSTIVVEDYPQPNVKLDHDFGTSGEYAGFDRFGRVVDQRWYDYGASAVRDQYRYAYDRAGNRLYRENTTSSGKDELYGYDEINRLVAFDRGDLNAGKTAISGTPGHEEDWTLDPTGNWTDYVQKTSGTTDLDQDRTHHQVNEITAVTATTGTDWADPVHDRAGNMTTLPKPSDPANTLTAKYDAWNRLVEVKDGTTVIGQYHYDGLNRRTRRDYDSGAPDNPSGVDTYVHYFYNDQWQVLETRETDIATAQAENIQPEYQYVWSPRYIDAAILRDENTDQDNLCDDERLYYLNDANFNVTALVDVNGGAVERYQYAPYGDVTIYDGSWSGSRNTSSYANVVLYTGRRLDHESTLHNFRKRYYASGLGQFVTRDPIGLDADDLNLYRYVLNSATNAVDPEGTEIRIIIPGGWTAGHCPEKCKDSPWGKRFDTKWIRAIAKEMRGEAGVRVKVFTPKYCGGTRYSLTCPAVNHRGERMFLVCIPGSLQNTCEGMALLEHEFVHVAQFANRDNRPREDLETEAYTRQCEVYAEQDCQQCKTEDEKKAWIRSCVDRLRPQSLGGNVDTIKNACRKLRLSEGL